MTTVTQQIETLGIEVDHIPGGCTGLAQPIVVGIGKPFKNRVQHKWEDWMLDGTIDEEVTKPPTHLQVVEWCCNSFREFLRYHSLQCLAQWQVFLLPCNK